MKKTGIRGLFFVLGVASALAARAEDPLVIELPLTGPAYVLADEAYKAYDRGDFQVATDKAREAIRLRPDIPRLREVLNQAQAALRAPVKVTPMAVPLAQPPSLQGAVPAPPEDKAFRSADAAYRAYDQGNHELAVRYARDAVRRQPANGSYWLLLVNALLAIQKYEEADQALADGMAQAGSSKEFTALLTRLPQERAVRLAAATPGATDPGHIPQDAGFNSADLAYKALDAKDYDTTLLRAREAIRLAPGNRSYRWLLINTLLAANRLDEADLAVSEALAIGDEDSELWAQRGQIRQRLGKSQLAEADFAAALRLGGLPLKLEVALLSDTGRKQEARQNFIRGLDAGAFSELADLDVAYLATRVGDDEKALEAFGLADRAGKLAGAAFSDAGFSATRQGRDREAASYFKRTIDAVEGLELRMAPQLLFETRRAVETVSRTSGVIASLNHVGAGTAASAGTAPGSANSGGLQAGVEAYWRPFGYQNGRTVEVFGRPFQTLQDRAGGATGSATVQGTVGVRWKPLTSQNLVFSLGRLVKIGSDSSNDWLVQTAYSAGMGTDLRVDVPSWWTAQGYGEVGRYIQREQTYAVASAQLGRSFRLDQANTKMVLFPHLTLNADYNSLSPEKTAVGMGPGLNFRYWFNDDFYTAPRSFVDLSLQYRFKLQGDERAQGFFMTTSISY